MFFSPFLGESDDGFTTKTHLEEKIALIVISVYTLNMKYFCSK